MVFVSQLDGGSTGFDPWKSEYANGAWSSPVNLGPSYNSAPGEYRPIRAFMVALKNK